MGAGHMGAGGFAAQAGRADVRRRCLRGTAAFAAVAIAAASIVTIPAVPAGAGKAPKGGTLSVEAPGVSVLRKGAARFTKAKQKQKIRTGDTVQTDRSGLAQIKFPDGSLTRLDHDTVFTLEKLSTKTGDRSVEGSVSAGQTWNRVQKLSEADTFEQEGSGATAAVLGTAFVTKCSMPPGVRFKKLKTKKQLRLLAKRSTCKFTLVDGRLQLTSPGGVLGITRGQSVNVGSGGTVGTVETLAPDLLFSDEWIMRNLDADSKAGISEATGQPTADDLRQARIEGSWATTLNVVANDGFRDLAPTRTRSYSFARSCNGGTCAVTLTRETANGTRVIPLTYVNGVYSGQDPDMGTQNCVLDDGTVSVVNGLRNSGTISFTPTVAVATNGLWRATSLSGTVTETATQVAGAPGQCRAASATFALGASR